MILTRTRSWGRLSCVAAALLGCLSAGGLLGSAVEAGPRGGRLLASSPVRAEFFVRADERVEITFLDEALRPVAPEGQVVSVVAEAPQGRAALELERTDSGFVSVAPVPEGRPYRVVVQVRPTADARPQNFRIDLDLHICGGCSLAEYACTCEGH